MKIGFIGAGVVGKSFGRYLINKDINVSGYYDINNIVSNEAARRTGTVCFSTLDAVLVNSDMIFITTNDDAIEKTCEDLVCSSYFEKRHIVAHMSGANSCKVLESASNKGAQVFAFHPLQTFSSGSINFEKFESIYFGLEIDGELPFEILNMITKIKNPYLRLNSEQKVKYHIAAVAVSNYLTTLIDFAMNQLNEIGIEKSIGFNAMMPLIEGALKNISTLGTENALTGPIARGDYLTVSKHIDCLASDSKALELYIEMAKATLELAKKEKLKDEDKIIKLTEIIRSN